MNHTFRKSNAAVSIGVIAAITTIAGSATAAPSPAERLALSVEGTSPGAGLHGRLEAEARRAYARAAAWYGVELDGPVTVRWVTDEGEMRRAGFDDPGAIAGAAQARQGRVLLFAPALAPRPDRIPTVMLHEFSHLLFARATAGAEVEPPRWLDEGLATWLSGDWDLGLAYRSDHARLLVDASAAGSLIPFHELDASFPRGPFFPLAYAQSRSFVEWMVEREGETGLLRFLGRLDRDLDPEPAFEGVWGMTIEEAETRWKRGLRGGGPLRFLPSGRTMFAFGSVLALGLVIIRWVRVRRQLRNATDDEPVDEPGNEPDNASSGGRSAGSHPDAP